MKIDHLPGHLAHQLAQQTSTQGANTDPAPEGEGTQGGDAADFDEAVTVQLSEDATKFATESHGPAHSTAHQARAAIQAGVADGQMPFGHIVRQIAQGYDFFAAAEAAAGEETPTSEGEAVVGDETIVAEEESVEPAAADSLPESGLAVEPGATDLELALLEELFEDLEQGSEEAV